MDLGKIIISLKKKRLIWGFVAVVFISLFLIIRGTLIKNDIQGGNCTIAKVDEIVNGPFGGRTGTYTFRLNGMEYTSYVDLPRSSKRADVLENFFIVKYNDQKPENSVMLLDVPYSFDTFKTRGISDRLCDSLEISLKNIK